MFACARACVYAYVFMCIRADLSLSPVLNCTSTVFIQG